jgi:hypothetical protein
MAKAKRFLWCLGLSLGVFLWLGCESLHAQQSASDGGSSSGAGDPFDAISQVLTSEVQQRIVSMGLDALGLGIIFLGLLYAIQGHVPVESVVGVILTAIFLLILASAGALQNFLQFWDALWKQAPEALAQFTGSKGG